MNRRSIFHTKKIFKHTEILDSLFVSKVQHVYVCMCHTDFLFELKEFEIAIVQRKKNVARFFVS